MNGIEREALILICRISANQLGLHWRSLSLHLLIRTHYLKPVNRLINNKMLTGCSQHQGMMMRRSDNRVKPYSQQQNMMPSMMNLMQRGMVYAYKEPCIPMKSEIPIRKAITVKVPTTPKRSNEKKGVAMVSSPEVKVNFDHLDSKVLLQKDLCAYPQPRIEDIPTAHTSTESLLSANNGYSKMMVRSQDNLIPPYMQAPYMCYPMPPMMNKQQQPFFHKRKMSYAGGLGVGNPMKRGMPDAPQYQSAAKKPMKNFYNKFNSPNEQNENTTILEIQCQIGKNEIRTFKLKKYDDLFTTLQQFIDMNQIRQELIQPIANMIFTSLNKIFWLCNNKVGQYDQVYLLSLQRLWKKNKDKCFIYNRNTSSKSSDSETSCSSQEKEAASQSFNYYKDTKDDETETKTNKSFS